MAIYLGSLELATGGGATGTGLPVNTYESFLVTTTGNPSGYNATTGLYTHPNGDYWLKTGSTVSDTAIPSAYPDATGVISWGSTTFISSTVAWNSPMRTDFPNIAPTNIAVAQVGGFLWAGPTAASGNSGTLQKYTTAGVFISQLQGIGQTLGDTFTDGHTANIFSFDFSGFAVREYDISGTNATPLNTYTLPGVTQAYFLTYDPTLGKYFTIDTANGNLIRYSTSFVEENRVTITTPAFNGLPWYAGYVSGNQLIANRNGTLYSYDTSMSNTDSTSAATNGAGSRDMALFNPTGTQDEFLFPAQNSFGNQSLNLAFGPEVGDSTARTDADSGQPLFIKLK